MAEEVGSLGEWSLILVVPIPDFNEHGLLPEGIHDCSWAELADCFCRFQSSDRRPRLCAGLREFVDHLRVAGLAHSLVIDGSFVTANPQPNDIDLILVMPANWNLHADLAPDSYNLLSNRQVKRRWGFDILVACEETTEYEQYLDLFQRVRYEEYRRKGVLLMRL